MYNRREGGVCIDGKNYRWYFMEKVLLWQVQDIQNNRLFTERDGINTNEKNRAAYLTGKIREYLSKQQGGGGTVVYNEAYLKYLDDNGL